MNKAIVILVCAVLLITTSCKIADKGTDAELPPVNENTGSQENTSPPTPTPGNLLLNEITNDVNCRIYLGMRRLEVDLSQLDPESDYFGGTDYKNEITGVAYRVGESEHFAYEAESLTDEICDFVCGSAEFTTSLGLRVGDDFENVVKLYGDTYNQVYSVFDRHDDYEYDMGSHYFTVSIENGVVRQWEVCLYEYGAW